VANLNHFVDRFAAVRAEVDAMPNGEAKALALTRLSFLATDTAHRISAAALVNEWKRVRESRR
jgi:hypothetical protein